MEFKKIQSAAFFALLLGVGFLFYKIIQPYVFALFWAAVMASLFYPIYRWLHKKMKNESMSAVITLIIAILVVVIPLSAVLGVVVQQAIGAYNTLNNPGTITNLKNAMDDLLAQPLVHRAIGDVDIDQKLQALSQTISSSGIEWLRIGSQSTVLAILHLFIMLYSFFFFLKNGERWLRHLMHLLPFGDENEKVLYNKFSSTVKATLQGTILIAFIQGSIEGVMFWIAGVPAPAFWGMLMIIASMIPSVGSSIIWAPTVLYLFAIGDTSSAVIVLVGGLFVSVIDNVIRPPLVGKNIQMPAILILISTLGGIGLFGISGIVIGPMITAFFMAIIQMYENKYKKELDSTQT